MTTILPSLNPARLIDFVLPPESRKIDQVTGRGRVLD